ncbi:MAG: LemA family protein [archaeon]
MGFKHAEFDTTTRVEEKGLLGKLTGENDAIYLRNKHQTEIDNAWSAIVNMVHYIESESYELKESYNKAQGIKRDIEAHEVEREKLYTNLGNLLNKETDFEKEMYKETTKMYKDVSKNQQAKSVNIKQRLKDSEVNEMKFASMMKYLEKYPEYQNKSSFKNITDKIDVKEREIREEKKKYNDAVSKYNNFLSNYPIWIKKAEDKVDIYEKLVKEAKEKLENLRYKKSILHTLATEKTKSSIAIDTTSHRLDQFTNTLNLLKQEHNKNKIKEFEEMQY